MAQETITLQDGTLVQVADFELGFTFDSKAVQVVDSDGPLIIEGYASDFDFDREDEAFEPGAFQKALKDYMQNPVMLYHHKYDTALGKFTDLRLDQKGLWVRGEVDQPEPGTQSADYYRKIKSGVIRGLSVGGKFYRRMTDAGMRIFKCDLREISVTPMPVNPRTIFAVAGKAFENMEDIKAVNAPATTEVPQELLDRLLAAETSIDASLAAMEGKSSQHPDGPKVAALLYHLQQIHTLATDTKQDAQSDNVKSASNDLAKHVEQHTKKFHQLASKIGPLPSNYGGTYL